MKLYLTIAVLCSLSSSAWAVCSASRAGGACVATDLESCAVEASKACSGASFQSSDCGITGSGASFSCSCINDAGDAFNCNKAGVCFAGDQTVDVKDSKGVIAEKKMSELKIGDNVRVGIDEFNKVFTFSHQVADAITNMFKFETNHGEIVLSGSHYIYANGVRKPASTVRPDEFLHHHNGTLLQIRKISQIQSKGLYAPHTEKGDIIVGGHRASCYTTSIKPDVAHNFLKPFAKIVNSGSFAGEKIGQLLTAVMQNEQVRKTATALFRED